jgi:hypothetical protein
MDLWQWRGGKRLIGRGRHVSDAGTRSKGVGSGGGPGCDLQELVSRRRTLSHLSTFPRLPSRARSILTAELVWGDMRAPHLDQPPLERQSSIPKLHIRSRRHIDLVLHQIHCTARVGRKVATFLEPSSPSHYYLDRNSLALGLTLQAVKEALVLPCLNIMK